MDCVISPLSDHLGVEARGVDLNDDPAEDVIARLRQAFVDHSVLVIRDQTFTPHEMLAAVRRFGDVFEQQNKRFALPECPEIHYISNQDRYPDGQRYIPGAGYHTDHSNHQLPPKATVLHAVKLPESGGDTQYVNMCAAYDGLPAEMKERIATLRAEHVYQSKHSERKLMELAAPARAKVPESVAHPLVRVHPESGRKAIYLNPIRVEGIAGMAEADAMILLDDLLDHATQEKFQYRHQWRVGDLVIWDNRCLLHKANGDYDHAQDRYLYRVMLQGDRPV